MTKGIRFSFKSVFICTGIAIMAIAAAMLVDFSPAARRQNVPATKQARNGLSGAAVRPAGGVGSPANQLVSNYGKLPLSFEANQGQTDSRVKFLSRGRGYSLFLTGDEAVLTLKRASQNANRKSQKAKVNALVAQHPPFGAAALPNLLPFPSASVENGWGQELEKPRDRRAGPALPSSPRLADSGESSAVLRMRLVGANPGAAVTGEDQLPGKSNYFIGNDPKKWRTNVPNYARVKYAGVYPGVDLVYYGNQGGQLEYDFVVAPDADPSVIALEVAAGLSLHPSSENGGAEPPLQIASDGDLVVKTDGGEVRFHKPVVYQTGIDHRSAVSAPQEQSVVLGLRPSDPGPRTVIEGRYTLDAQNQVRFQVAPYDRTRALFIDPVLSYSTFLGGSFQDVGTGIAVDSTDNAYVTGWTYSTDFPTVDPIQATCAGCGLYAYTDAFVAKLNPAGSALVYSTYLGGSWYDYGYAIAADSSGNAYVTGSTGSRDFPTVNPLQPTNPGGWYAFVAKLDATGSALMYSTYLGGSSDYGNSGHGITVDSSGNAYVTGNTGSKAFPTVNPLQATNHGYENAFVAKFNAAGSALVYSTYLGGSNGDSGQGIAVDSSGNAYVEGVTSSADFLTVNPFQATNHSYVNAFVAKLNATGSALVYSTYLGGSGGDQGYGVAVDPAGNAYVTGFTFSTDFPTVNPIQVSNHGFPNVFVAKLNATGSALVYSTYLGGSSEDLGSGITVDSSGNASVTGSTQSTDFPTVDPLQAMNKAAPNPTAFVANLNAAGSALVYSTFLGGSGGEDFLGGLATGAIAVDSSGSVYVTGATDSKDFPTFNPLQATCGGCDYPPEANGDAFVAKISPGGPGVSLSSSSLTFGPQNVGATSAPETVTLSNPGVATLSVPGIVTSGDFAQSNDCGSSLTAGTSCAISVNFTPTSIGTRTGAVTITDNTPGSPETVPLTGTGINPRAGLAPTSLAFGNQVINTTSAAGNMTLTSTGTTNLNISRVSLTGANAGDFAQTNNCLTSLGPGAICTSNVTFTPTQTGARTANLAIIDNASNSPQTVALLGYGVPPPALNPTSLTFGGQAENATSPPLAVTLINAQSTALAISSVTTSGDFAQTNTCGSSVLAGGRCTISVTYTPGSLGVETGTLTVTDGASNSPQTASLVGRGVLQAQLSTPSVAFAAQTVGSTSPAWNVLLGNNLSTALPISITFTGADPGDFAETNTCGASLAARSRCTISLTFTPGATGTRTATLTVTDSANNSPQTMALTGTGQ